MSQQGVTFQPTTTVGKAAPKLVTKVLSVGCTDADKLAAKLAAQVSSRGRAAVGKSALRLAAQVSHGRTAVDELAARLAARVLSQGRVVRWEGILLVGQERWVEVGLAIGLAASVAWGGRPVELEQVQEAMGEVLLELGWCIIK